MIYVSKNNQINGIETKEESVDLSFTDCIGILNSLCWVLLSVIDKNRFHLPEKKFRILFLRIRLSRNGLRLPVAVEIYILSGSMKR